MTSFGTVHYIAYLPNDVTHVFSLPIRVLTVVPGRQFETPEYTQSTSLEQQLEDRFQNLFVHFFIFKMNLLVIHRRGCFSENESVIILR